MQASQKEWQGKAIVANDTLPNKGWKLQDVEIKEEDLNDDELVVEMVASGVCHTDVRFGSREPDDKAFFYPRVLGHEGSGYVRAVGSKVTLAKPGDAVLLSYDRCDDCLACKGGIPSHCYDSMKLNFGKRPTFTSAGSEDKISGRFFGQSSFANYSVVREKSVVNATDLVKDKRELQMFAPLGCGVQTGAGTVTNVAKATADDSIAVLGLGGVGLSSIMAAKISGCRIILGIDQVPSRLELAKEVGATHVIDTSKLPEGKPFVQVVQEICDGVGPHHAIETTGVPVLIQAATEMTRNGGKIIQVAAGPPGYHVEIPTHPWMVSGKSYVGAVQGHSVAAVYIPKMIQWYREGKFPFDKLIKLMPVEEFERGIHEMHTGETIKPVLLWS